LDVGPEAGVGDGGVNSSPGPRPSNTFFTGSSRIPEEDKLDEIPSEADISTMRRHLFEVHLENPEEGREVPSPSRHERDPTGQLERTHCDNDDEDPKGVPADNMKPDFSGSMGSQQHIMWTSSDEELYGTTSKSVLSYGPSIQGQNPPPSNEQDMAGIDGPSIMAPHSELQDQPVQDLHANSRHSQAHESQDLQSEKRELVTEGSVEGPPRKRRRIDTRPLYNVIPEVRHISFLNFYKS
jgi:hypothetical protein